MVPSNSVLNHMMLPWVSEVIYYCDYFGFGNICMVLTSFYAHLCIFCAVPYCAVLCCVVPCRAVTCWAVLCCAVLRCAVLRCAVLRCAVLRCAVSCISCTPWSGVGWRRRGSAWWFRCVGRGGSVRARFIRLVGGWWAWFDVVNVACWVGMGGTSGLVWWAAVRWVSLPLGLCLGVVVFGALWSVLFPRGAPGLAGWGAVAPSMRLVLVPWVFAFPSVALFSSVPGVVAYSWFLPWC